MRVKILTAILLSLSSTTGGCQCSSDAPKAPFTTAGPRSWAGSTPQTQQDLDTVVARVGDATITVQMLQERINDQAPPIRARHTSREGKKDFLDTLVRFEVLAQHAQSLGLDGDPEVVRAMRRAMVDRLMTNQLGAIGGPDDITDAEAREYYDAHRDEYDTPEETRVAAIIIRGKAKAEQVAKLANGEAGKTSKGFRELVAAYSSDELTKHRGGDLRYFNRDSREYPAPVVEAAFALQEHGEVSDAIDVGTNEYYIIRRTGHREATKREFDQVKRLIRNHIYSVKRTEAQRAFADSLEADAKGQVFEDELDKVRVEIPARVRDAHNSDVPAAPAQTQEELDTVLARIGDATITVQTFQDRINDQSPLVRTRFATLEGKKDYLDQLVRFEVLAQHAQSLGLDRDPEVVQAMRQAMVDKMTENHLDASSSRDDITLAEMSDYYEAHRDEYDRPEETRVAAIVVRDEATAERVAELAQGEVGRTAKGFRELVAEYSIDEMTKLRGGDLGFFAEGSSEYPAPVVAMAFSLPDHGQVSDAIEAASNAYYILRKTGHRKAATREFDQVKRQIRDLLYRDKRKELERVFVQGLMADSKIQIFEDELDKVRVEIPTSRDSRNSNIPVHSPREEG